MSGKTKVSYSKSNRPKIVTVSSDADTKEFFKLFDYWHKKGVIGFVPLFIMYRVRDKGELLLYKQGDKVIGMAWVIPRQRPYQFYQIKTFAISPDYQGKGYGEKFLTDIIESIDTDTDIKTSVLTSNEPAINLYKKVGFHVVDTVTSAKGIETYEMEFAPS